MIKKILKLLKKFLPSLFYWYMKKIYLFFMDYRSQNYDLSKDLYYNESLIKSFRLDIDKIKLRLNSTNYSYQSTSLSWHYHLFAGLKDYFKDKKISILEIGTHNAEFTNFISKIYEKSLITTIDLDENDEQFKNTYNRDHKKELDNFLKLREEKLNRNNVNFIKLNSINIKKYFFGKKFDLIWVDGDHLNPQVTIDIINSLDLLNSNGILCVDDIIKDINFKKNNYVSNESYFTLNHLESSKKIKNYFFIKRIRRENSYKKKYCSLSIFYQNNNLKKKDKE